MKHKILLAVLAAGLLLPCRSMAQQVKSVPDVYFAPPKVYGGAKLGANYSVIDGDFAFKRKFNPGITGGFFAGLQNEYLGVKFELLFSSSRADLVDTFEGGGSIKTLTMAIPILFECKVIPKVWLQIGPQFGTLLDANQFPDGQNDPKSFFQSSNFSGVIGVEVMVNKNFSAGARYLLGISDVRSPYITVTQQTWRTQAIQAYLSVKVF